MMNKLEQLKNIFVNETDGILLISEVNRYWLLNFSTSFGIVLINKSGQIIFITDSRYFLAAVNFLKNNKNIDVWCLNQQLSLIELIKKAMSELKVSDILIEDEYVTLNQFKWIKEITNNVSTFNAKAIRSVKTLEEINALQASANLIVEVMKWVKSNLRVGISEKEFAKMISMKILELGAEGNSFSPIVAAGKNSANPHHKPSNYLIQDGDFVTIDIGCMYRGYASDMTRAFVVGNKCNCDEMLKIYDIVLKAQLAGIAAANNKISGKDLDLVCRNIIDQSSFAGLFVHGTGHGVGMEVHELPNVNASYTKQLEKNNVITIEPGVYKENIGGIRIEDTIVITEKECVILTNFPKEIQYV